MKKKVPKQSWGAIGILWLMFMLNANGREILNRLAPYITDTYNLTATQASLGAFVASIGVALASAFVPAWSDKKGKGWKRKYCLIAFSIGYMVFTAVCGFEFLCGAYGAYLAFQFIRGFFSGAGDANEVGNATEWFPVEKSGIALGVQHTGYPWGTFVGGLIISGVLLLVGDENWRICWFIFPVLGILIWFLVGKYWNARNYEAFEKKTLENNWTPPLHGVKEEEKEAAGSMKDCMKNPHAWVGFLAFLFAHVSYYGYSFWMPLYLAYIADYDYAIAASLSIVFTITAGLGQIVWGSLSDKFGAKRCLIIATLWYAVGLALMPMISQGFFFLIACQLFMGCASNGLFIIIYDLLTKSCRPGTTITTFGFANVGLYIGAAVGSIISGFLIDLGGGLSSVSGYMTAIYLFAVMAALACLITILFAREVCGKRLGKSWSLLSEDKYYFALLDIQNKKEE